MRSRDALSGCHHALLPLPQVPTLSVPCKARCMKYKALCCCRGAGVRKSNRPGNMLHSVIAWPWSPVLLTKQPTHTLSLTLYRMPCRTSRTRLPHHLQAPREQPQGLTHNANLRRRHSSPPLRAGKLSLSSGQKAWLAISRRSAWRTSCVMSALKWSLGEWSMSTCPIGVVCWWCVLFLKQSYSKAWPHMPMEHAPRLLY